MPARAKPDEIRRPHAIKCAHSGKVCYATHARALRAGRRHGVHGSAYRCAHCGCHHFTSQTKRVRKAILLLLGRSP